MNEVQSRVRKGYLDRLNDRSKKMRKLYVERKWIELRTECTHLKNTASSFGFPSITHLAKEVEGTIPTELTSRAKSPPRARKTVEELLSAIDHILIADSMYQE